MKNGYLLLILVLFRYSDALSVTWMRTYGGNDYDYGTSVYQTSDGGYIIAGATRSYGAGDYDVYLIKIDSLGDTLWTKTFGGNNRDYGSSVCQTTDRGYIIAGYTRSYGAGDYDVYLIKTDSLGDTLWTKTFGGDTADYGYSVTQTSDGGYIIAGTSWSYGASGDVYLIKTDSLGDTLWTKTFGGDTTDYGCSVTQTSDGGYIIAGYTHSYGAGKYDVYLIKTDSLGDTLWTKTFGGDEWDYGLSVCQTSDGGYIVTGSLMETSNSDVYLIKTDSLGDTLWTRTFGGEAPDMGYSVCQTTDGGYIVAGVFACYPLPGTGKLYLIKTDSLGDTLWTRLFAPNMENLGHSVSQTPDKGYIVAGYTGSHHDICNFDVWVIKLDSLGNVGVEEEVKSSEFRVQSQLQIKPNPFVGTTAIKLSPINRDFASSTSYQAIQEKLKIYDLGGRLVEEEKLGVIGKSLRTGVYFVKVKGYKPVKIVKLK